jgi:predicted ester cyclase
MSVEEQNKALFHRWFGEVWNKGNYGVAYEVIDPDFVVHGAGGQVVKQGPDGVIGLVKTWRTAFPDGQMTIDGLIAEGELVTALLTWRGTHRGDFYGIPASGNKVEVTSIGTDRIVNGKVVAGWGEVDMLGMMQQLGAISLVPQRQVGAQARSATQEWAIARVQTQQSASASVDNKAILLRFIQAINEWDMNVVKEVVDVTNYIEYNPSLRVTSFGESVQAYAMLRIALPDLQFVPDPDLLVCEGDLVAARWVATGTHTGSALFGMSPSGKRLDWTGIDFSRISDGKIVESWLCADILRLAQQLGAVPSAGG